MRKALKSLNHKEYKNILKRLKETINNFEHVQNGFDRNPLDKELTAKEKRQKGRLRELSQADESLEKQKSRVLGLKERDKNISAYPKNHLCYWFWGHFKVVCTFM